MTPKDKQLLRLYREMVSPIGVAAKYHAQQRKEAPRYLKRIEALKRLVRY
jgi:hypothetical protein